MNIPMKYEDVVSKLDAALGREADLIASANQNKLMTDAACGEIATLQEELAEFELVQQRLTVAEQRAGELEVDKRRLDFIQENWITIRCNVKNTGFCVPKGKEFEAYIYSAGANDKRPGEGETIRQAIDNMAETNGAALKPAAEGDKS